MLLILGFDLVLYIEGVCRVIQFTHLAIILELLPTDISFKLSKVSYLTEVESTVLDGSSKGSIKVISWSLKKVA